MRALVGSDARWGAICRYGKAGRTACNEGTGKCHGVQVAEGWIGKRTEEGEEESLPVAQTNAHRTGGFADSVASPWLTRDTVKCARERRKHVDRWCHMAAGAGRASRNQTDGEQGEPGRPLTVRARWAAHSHWEGVEGGSASAARQRERATGPGVRGRW